MAAPSSPWLEHRRTGITGSDAAALLGLDPFRSRIEVWAEKVGMLRSRSLDEVEAVKWGSILEAPIIREVLARTRRERARTREWPELFSQGEVLPLMHRWLDGGRVQERAKWIIASRRVEHAMATPDFAFRNWLPMPGAEYEERGLAGPGIGEIKTTSYLSRHNWAGGPPLRVQAQVQHELLVGGGASWGTAAVLIGGQALRIFDFAAHPAFMRLLEEAIGEFWHWHVRTGTPPEPEGTEQEREALARIYPEDDGSLAVLPASDLRHAQRLDRLKPLLRRIESEVSARETLLRARIGRASLAVIDGTGIGYSLRADSRGVRRLLRLKNNALVAPLGPALHNKARGEEGA